eukprot:gnl/TRDRNA2_/TRDRNA2_86315_c0_seq1.p2 gnl/TRDRNA2_/TRDRNA2_86315_c0~~gnl/TRDRNA2_/TRDRNA2_86315_c0_seq1.p2  ORF type:complete len:106 (+),score=7.79 gnl/TRDRNA2_/TRDRNA2_86315_c0_seq1:179-496(+)
MDPVSPFMEDVSHVPSQRKSLKSDDSMFSGDEVFEGGLSTLPDFTSLGLSSVVAPPAEPSSAVAPAGACAGVEVRNQSLSLAVPGQGPPARTSRAVDLAVAYAFT